MRLRRASCRVPSPKPASRPVQPGGFPSMCMPAKRDRKRCLCISKSILSSVQLHPVIPAQAAIRRFRWPAVDLGFRGGGFVHYGKGRRLVVFSLLAAASLIQPSPAAAHGFGQRYDLPLPLSLYLFGAAAAVVVSFVIVGLLVRESPGAVFDWRLDLR